MIYIKTEMTEIMTIKEIRALTGLSQQKFSFATQIPLNSLRAWETGYRTPPDYVVKLLEYFVTRELKKPSD